MKKTFYTEFMKGFIDRVLGLVGLICLSWLFLILAVAIYIDDPGPILYRQRRVGRKKNGEITYFNILKFRTMKVSTPELPTHLLENPEQWITRAGADDGQVVGNGDVPQLGQLIQAGLAEDPAHPGDPLLRIFQQMGGQLGSAHLHGAELENVEIGDLPVLLPAHPALAVKNGAGIVNINGHRQNQEKPGQTDEAQKAQYPVDEAIHKLGIKCFFHAISLLHST